ncbi:hypothetical protein D9M71_301150 [compost metagenome]
MDLPQQGGLAKTGRCRDQHQPRRQGSQEWFEQMRARNDTARTVRRLQLGHEQARVRLALRSIVVWIGHLGHTPHHPMNSGPLNARPHRSHRIPRSGYQSIIVAIRKPRASLCPLAFGAWLNPPELAPGSDSAPGHCVDLQGATDPRRHTAPAATFLRADPARRGRTGWLTAPWSCSRPRQIRH